MQVGTKSTEKMELNRKQRRIPSAIEDLACLSLFALSLLLVFVIVLHNLLMQFDGVASNENRHLAQITAKEFEANPTATLEHYFNDRFPYREKMISDMAWLRYRWLSSTRSKKVLIGKEGWLFYKEDEAENFLHNDRPFNEDQLKWWAARLEKRHEWLAARGIKYIFYAPPITSTIYPEKLPDNFKRLPGPSRLDQLISYLRTHTHVKIIDVRPCLLSAKQFPIYFKRDTHWNSFGAYLACGPVIDALRTWFPKISKREPWELDLEVAKYDGDLISMIGIDHYPETVLLQNRFARKRWKAEPQCFDLTTTQLRKPFTTLVDDDSLPSAVCIRDSYTIAMRDFLSNHFKRILYGWWDEFPYDVIEKEHPDVVLEEKVERLI